MSLHRLVEGPDNTLAGYSFHCPGCGWEHPFRTVPGHDEPVWDFDGDMEAPTFSPSLRMRYSDDIGKHNSVCHLFLRNGVLEFLSDCTHELAGQKVPLEPEP